MPKTAHELKVEQVEIAIDELTHDQTVEITELIASVVSLIEKMEIALDALRSDL